MLNDILDIAGITAGIAIFAKIIVDLTRSVQYSGEAHYWLYDRDYVGKIDDISSRVKRLENLTQQRATMQANEISDLRKEVEELKQQLEGKPFDYYLNIKNFDLQKDIRW